MAAETRTRRPVRGIGLVVALAALVAGHAAPGWGVEPAPAMTAVAERSPVRMAVDDGGPDIDSSEFLPLDSADDGTTTSGGCAVDEQNRGYAGLYSTFTFDAAGTDTVRYRYGFDEEPRHELIPRDASGAVVPGGPVTVRWFPETPGPHRVSVYAYDGLGAGRTEATCHFSVSTRLAIGEWNLDDAPGAAVAADARGVNPLDVPATVQLGVTGPGCRSWSCNRDRAARFSGDSDSFLATHTSALVDTGKAFTATAWVRLTDNGRERIAVSQDATGRPGFTLGFDAATRRWAFKVPATDAGSPTMRASRSSATAVMNEWTHLAGVYDAETATVRLYVDGMPQTATPRRSAFSSHGAVQIGRALGRSGYRALWQGDLAAVAVYDRMVTATEIRELAVTRPVRLAYWQLNSSAEGRSAEFAGSPSRDLLLEGGADIRIPDPDDLSAERALMGEGELLLDGVDDRARTPGPVVPMGGGSFSVTARVRPATDECTRNMTVLSQAGTIGSGFRIQCSADGYWQVVVPGSDRTAPAEVVTIRDESVFPRSDPGGQHLAVVYDAATRGLSFYVNGERSTVEPVKVGSMFNATGGFQIGRAMVGGTFGEYFAGSIDDVRVYSGALDDTTVTLLASLVEQPTL